MKITVKGFQNVNEIFRTILKIYLHPKLFIYHTLKFILHMLKRELDKTINKRSLLTPPLTMLHTNNPCNSQVNSSSIKHANKQGESE